MIYDNLNLCTNTEFVFLIDKFREKLSVANDRIVMLEAEAERQFMAACELNEFNLKLQEKLLSLQDICDGLFCLIDSGPVLSPDFRGERDALRRTFLKMFPEEDGSDLPF